MGEVRWLHAEAAKARHAPLREEPEPGDLEPHAVERACGHWETLQVARPWAYLDRVAALIRCAVCRRGGMQGPIEANENGLWAGGCAANPEEDRFQLVFLRSSTRRAVPDTSKRLPRFWAAVVEGRRQRGGRSR